MAAGISGTAGPFVLGVVAERWGIRSVFAATAAALGIGFIAFAGGLAVLRAAKNSSSGRQAEISLVQD